MSYIYLYIKTEVLSYRSVVVTNSAYCSSSYLANINLCMEPCRGHKLEKTKN